MRIEELERALARWLPAVGAPLADEQPPPPPDAAAVPVVLDESALADLAPGEPAVVAELIDQFLAEAPTRAHAVRVALTQRDAPALQRAAHLFKGEAGSIGARELAAACARLESLAGADRLAGGLDALQAFEAAYADTSEALKSLRTRSVG